MVQLQGEILVFTVFYAWLFVTVPAMQSCGMQLTDEPERRCYPLYGRLFCRSCRLSQEIWIKRLFLFNNPVQLTWSCSFAPPQLQPFSKSFSPDSFPFFPVLFKLALFVVRGCFLYLFDLPIDISSSSTCPSSPSSDYFLGDLENHSSIQLPHSYFGCPICTNTQIQC